MKIKGRKGIGKIIDGLYFLDSCWTVYFIYKMERKVD